MDVELVPSYDLRIVLATPISSKVMVYKPVTFLSTDALIILLEDEDQLCNLYIEKPCIFSVISLIL